MITEAKQVTKNFNSSEFACKHCGNIYISEALIKNLQTLGDHLHFSKAKVISGYRCKNHPVELQNKNTGQHTKGLAADIEYYDKNGKLVPAKIVICLAYDLNLFKGLANVENASSEGEVHLDIRESGSYRGDETIDYKTHWTNPYSYYGVTKEDVEKYTEATSKQLEVEKDITKDQLKVLVNALKIRIEPTTESMVYKDAIKGAYYNYTETVKNENYTWYKIGDNKWIANNGTYLEIIPKAQSTNEEEIQKLKGIIKQKDKEIKDYQIEIKDLDAQIKELTSYKFKYTCEKDGKYLKTLKKGETLLIK